MEPSFSHPAELHENRSPRYVVIVEPYAAHFRYLQIARRRFRTLVLTNDPADCVLREREYRESLGQPDSVEIDRLLQCNTADVSAMYELLKPLRNEIAGVLTGQEAFLPVSVDLGWKLGFDSARPEDAITHHVKTAMKLRFQECVVPTPRFFIVRTLEEAKQAWQNLGRDCMVKMVDASSSMNIFRATTMQELDSAWDIIVNNRRNVKSVVPLSTEVILEEFVDGRELSIEGYTQGDRVVCLNFSEKITESTFVVVGHLLPALLSSKEEEILRRVAEHVVRAEGMRNSVFHIEVHLQEDKPYVIECTSRPPGQHTVELMFRSLGFDLIDISISLAVGEPVFQVAGNPKVHFAMLALYSMSQGIFERLEGIEEVKARGGLVHLYLGAKPGDVIEPLATFHQRYGFIILEDATSEGIREKARWARSNLRIALAREPHTEAIGSNH